MKHFSPAFAFFLALLLGLLSGVVCVAAFLFAALGSIRPPWEVVWGFFLVACTFSVVFIVPRWFWRRYLAVRAAAPKYPDSDSKLRSFRS